jgi:hypothetical protein
MALSTSHTSASSSSQAVRIGFAQLPDLLIQLVQQREEELLVGEGADAGSLAFGAGDG